MNEDSTDPHFRIMRQDLEASMGRYSSLYGRWANRASESLLPPPSKLGAFAEIMRMIDAQAGRIGIFFEPIRPETKAKFPDTLPNPTRYFGNVFELTDKMKTVHRDLATLERSYWQRIEGYDPPSGDEIIRGGTVSECGAIQQIFNAADKSCSCYWDSIFNDPLGRPWDGLVVFGEHHEFRHRNKFIFMPDYAKTLHTRTWIYLSHETSHQAIDMLMKDKSHPEFREIYLDLLSIFRQYRSVSKKFSKSPEQLADETLADIMATLIGGEQYVLCLASLKYYPSLTLFTNRKARLSGRRISYPVFLRTKVSLHTLWQAWGFGSDTSRKNNEKVLDQALLSALTRVLKGDHKSEKLIRSFLAKSDMELEEATQFQWTAEVVRRHLQYWLDALEDMRIWEGPDLIESLLELKIIPRLKRFVKCDFYKTDPNSFYYDVVFDDVSDKAIITESSGARKIDKNKATRNSMLERISNEIKNSTLVDAEPRDIIACLNRLNQDEEKEQWNHIALCSMFRQNTHNHEEQNIFSASKTENRTRSGTSKD